MRLRLLDATVECLVTYGYAGTTTHRVAELAGVTRGAQIHHFPAKEDLVVAAIEHLAQQRARVTIREVGRIRESPDPAAAVLDFLWEVHQGPIVVATLELWMASRTDPVLAKHVQRVEPVVNGALLAAIEQVLPDRSAQNELRYAVYTAMDALRGILVAGFVDGDRRPAAQALGPGERAPAAGSARRAGRRRARLSRCGSRAGDHGGTWDRFASCLDTIW